jgi:predicted DNA-binding transcriptional regulator AlpA
MGKPHRSFTPEPRAWNAHQLAGYLGVSDTKFAELRKQKNFPQPLPYGSRWDRKAIDEWLDTVGGLKDVPEINSAKGIDQSSPWSKAVKDG